MWQTSIGSLMGAADGRDFVMHSRIGVRTETLRECLILVTKTHWGKLGR